jgi:UBX domain-containing protein 7
MDEAIAQVVLVTNTTPEKAAQYVTLADGDVDQAVTLFFENDGADLSGALPSATQTHTTTSRLADRGNSGNPINLDDDNISDDNDPEITGYRRVGAGESSLDDDEAMARRLQEEMYGAVGLEDDGIRAPIARQTETLLGPGAAMGPTSGIEADVEQRMYDIQRRRGQGRPGCLSVTKYG